MTNFGLAGSTEIMTIDGNKSLTSLVGERTKVLTSVPPYQEGTAHNGVWRDAEVVPVGEEKVVDIHISRNGVTKTITAHEEQQWYTYHPNRSEHAKRIDTKFVADLKEKDKVPSLVVKPSRPNVSPIGVAAGAVYGDGSLRKDSAHIHLYGEKDSNLLPYFSMHNTSAGVLESGVPFVVVQGLPKYFKKAPPLDEGASYLAGWLAGYIAADGSVADDGMVSISSSKEESMDLVVKVANRLGISHRGIRAGEITVNFPNDYDRNGEKQMKYLVTFDKLNFPTNLLIIPEHLRKYQESGEAKYVRNRWKIDGVISREDREMVYCIDVPGYNNVTLSGNIRVPTKELTNV